ncbi:MAG TPA: Glu/Leu/Phe/Val dehydrogenase [Gemmatales bacterium]|nr:Glu/Leu/Phe/Val dehydrogenase [Gemmatales bacterium]
MSTTALDRYYDVLGPEKIVHLFDPHTEMRGFVVIDNTACGPAIGGVRMAVDVSVDEVYRLARAMTLKNAAAGLPHGGGKAGLIADPKGKNKASLVRSFARSIRELTSYIPGPDMGTDETCMGLIWDEIGRSVGLPSVLGGIPLDKIGATGYGLARCAEVASEFAGLKLKGATLGIEGFGNVGRPAAQFLAELGVRLVAASDSKGAVYDAQGIDIEKLIQTKDRTGTVTSYAGGKKMEAKDLFGVACDILIPAAKPDCINERNVASIKAKLILQGANIPATHAAETTLRERGVFVVPDFIANAGGVICASVEFHGGTQSLAFDMIAQRIRDNTRSVFTRSRDERISPRQAAVDLATERVRTAMAMRKKNGS